MTESVTMIRLVTLCSLLSAQVWSLSKTELDFVLAQFRRRPECLKVVADFHRDDLVVLGDEFDVHPMVIIETSQNNQVPFPTYGGALQPPEH